MHKINIADSLDMGGRKLSVNGKSMRNWRIWKIIKAG